MTKTKALISFDKETLTLVDRVRGLIPRSAWINSLCKNAAALGYQPQATATKSQPFSGEVAK